MAKVLIYPSNVVPGLSLVITKLGHTPVYKNNTKPPYNVSGLVLDFNKEPIDRDIVVYSTTTNKLVGKSRSKEDGTY